MGQRTILVTATLVSLLLALPSGIAAQQASASRNDCTSLAEAVEKRSAAVRAGTLVGTPAAGWTGMAYRGDFNVENGVPKLAGPPEVTQVICDSPAHRAGVRAGDLILSVNGRHPGEPGVLTPRRPGLRFDLRVRRGERVLEVSFVSVPRPPELMT